MGEGAGGRKEGVGKRRGWGQPVLSGVRIAKGDREEEREEEKKKEERRKGEGGRKEEGKGEAKKGRGEQCEPS